MVARFCLMSFYFNGESVAGPVPVLFSADPDGTLEAAKADVGGIRSGESKNFYKQNFTELESTSSFHVTTHAKKKVKKLVIT